MSSLSKSGMRKVACALIIFICFFAFYLVFLANNHFTVDGATRALEVFWSPKLVLHGNNHILYPFNVYLWSKGAEFAAGEASDAFVFIRRVQVMNATMAAVIISLSYLIFLKILRNEKLSLTLVSIFGISNAFFSHAVSSAEPMTGFFFFIIALFLIVYFSHRRVVYAISPLILAYAAMSYLSMVFGLAFIIAYLYSTSKSKKQVVAYCLIFAFAFIILFFAASSYKGSGITNALSENRFTDSSHTGFKLKNIPQYPFGMISAFYHINNIYDLPTYLASVKSFDINSVFSVVLGIIIFLVVVLLGLGFFRIISQAISKKEITTELGAVVYFISASLSLILFVPIYDKLWIMGLHSFLLVAGISYANLQKRLKIPIFALMLAGIAIIMVFNLMFAISAKAVADDIDCARKSVSLMGDHYILLNNWGARYGMYFKPFFYKRDSLYYSVPNLAIEQGMDTSKVVSFLKQKYCSGDYTALYIISDLYMDKEMWNTFLGDEMKMDFAIFHREILDKGKPITECVYKADKSIC